MNIRPVQHRDFEPWYRMRVALWPEVTQPDDLRDMHDCLDGKGMTVFVAESADGSLVGFLEANIRPYAAGCQTRNVGYIEGWYVEEEFRRQGIGAALVEAAENWARSKGCREMASDCLQENGLSLAAHLALGYQEKERLIHFGKTL